MELQHIFETTKEQRVEFTHQVIERLNNGELDPLKTHLQVKALEDMLETLKANKDYKDAVLNAAVQNGKDFEYMSAKFNIREVGVKYDYTKCESPAYEEIMTEYNTAAKSKKDMEEFLKKVPHQGLDIINGVTGEVTRVYPPAKSSGIIKIIKILYFFAICLPLAALAYIGGHLAYELMLKLRK